MNNVHIGNSFKCMIRETGDVYNEYSCYFQDSNS